MPVHYYDLVLLLIVGCLGLGVAIGALTPMSIYASVPMLSAVAIVIIGHAMFLRGPIDDIDDLTEPVEPEELPVLSAIVE